MVSSAAPDLVASGADVSSAPQAAMSDASNATVILRLNDPSMGFFFACCG
jgi:hypothetical protein